MDTKKDFISLGVRVPCAFIEFPAERDFVKYSESYLLLNRLTSFLSMAISPIAGYKGSLSVD